MKIDGQYPKVPVQDKNVQAEKEQLQIDKKKPPVLKPAGTRDFSIHKIKDRIEAEPDINLEKVKALREKLKNGEYQVDSGKLANHLIRDSLVEDI